MSDKPDDFDEFDDLKAAFDAATPKVDPAKKSADLKLAMENFARLQETRNASRPSSESRSIVGRLFGGGHFMKNRISPLMGALTATTALVAVGIFLVIPGTRDLFSTQEVSSVAPEVKPNGPVKPVTPAGDDRAATVASTDQPVGRVEVDGLTTADAGEVAPGAQAEPAPMAQPQPAPDLTAPAASVTALGGESDANGGDLPMPNPGLEALPMAEPEPVDEEAVIADAVTGTLNEFATEQPPAPEMKRMAANEPALKPEAEMAPPVEPNTEAFANEDEPNPVKITSVEPVSTFSIDVDTASYSVVRSSLMAGFLPDPMAVRIEEMVNYFPYAYAAPEGDKAFQTTVSVMQTPWNKDTELVHIAIQGQLPAIEERPPLNLVFLIDTSGSMEDANKLPLLKQSFRLMVNELRPEDRVAIVTYAGSAGLVLEPTAASEKDTILAALENLSAGGSTAGQEGLQQAYSVAESMMTDGAVSRILLATDGDFNVGIYDPAELEDFIAKKRETGTYLSVLGFGRGNLDDAVMQSLAQNGNGTAAYIDTLSEAQKVLVDQLTGALFPIANDVKIQIEWNPALVAEYRLIGYETRELAREDFNNDKVDAGEIGAGHTVTAIYEITPVGSPAILNDDLRYRPAVTTDTGANVAELGFLKLRHKAPGEDTSVLEETPIPADVKDAGSEARFAAAIAGFGQLLTGSKYLGDWTYADAISLANGAKGEDPYGYRAEAVTLMRLAETLSD
jgi:Ca-activated chloride channel homolog